jgi:flagellar biosynthesis protein FlhB
MLDFPLKYQVACIVLTALFVWSFSVAREPRGWRRLFQSLFSKSDDFSVNKNKMIDESLKKYGIIIAMVILVADVTCFVWGITNRYRVTAEQMSSEDWNRLNEINRIKSTSPSSRASQGL